MSFLGAFESQEIHLMSDAVRRSEQALQARGVQVDDGPSGLEQRDLLSRIVLDIFRDGERNVAQAVDECVSRFLSLRLAEPRADAA